MAPPMGDRTAYTLARKLVRTGVPAREIRQRIDKVLKAVTATSSDPKSLQAHSSEARTELLNEGFAELRYRSLLQVMHNEMPRFPIPRNHLEPPPSNAMFPGGSPSERPPVPQVTAPAKSKTAVGFPVPTLPEGGDSPIDLSAARKGQQAPACQAVREGRLRRLYKWWGKQVEQQQQRAPPPEDEPATAPSSSAATPPNHLQKQQESSTEVAVKDEDREKAIDFSPLEARFLIARRLRQIMEFMQNGGTADTHRAHRLTGQALKVLGYTHGEDHPSLIPVLNVYAFTSLLCGEMKRCEEALEKLEHLLESPDNIRSFLHPHDPLIFDPKREKAVMLATKARKALVQQNFEGVIEHATAALALFEEVGAKVPDIYLSLMLARALGECGRVEEADKRFKAILNEVVREHSHTSARIAPHLRYMVGFALKQEKFHDAKVLAATAYRNLHEQLGEFHPQTLSSMQQVAEVMLRSKEYRAAAKWLVVLNRLYLEHLMKYKTNLSPLDRAKALHLLSLSYLGLDRFKSAVQVSTQCLWLYEKLLGPTAPQLRDPLLAWATAYRMAGAHASRNGAELAIPALEKLLMVIVKAEKAGHRSTGPPGTASN
eukprot:Sspe_Gene.92928::Locus_65675_Transcript_1_1_Confidence_1.000_Length_1859::g.92928::m.92928